MYGILAPWPAADKNSLKIQQRAVKMESGVTGTSYEERLAELGLETLEERRHQANLAMVHKILKSKGQLDYTCWFEKAADCQGGTRSAADPLNLEVSQTAG